MIIIQRIFIIVDIFLENWINVNENTSLVFTIVSRFNFICLADYCLELNYYKCIYVHDKDDLIIIKSNTLKQKNEVIKIES